MLQQWQPFGAPMNHHAVNAVFFTTAKFARMLGIHPRTLYEWLRCGRLPEPKRIARGKVSARLFTEGDLKRAQQLKARNNLFRQEQGNRER
jgi:predicted DNA-binding transcriptional regulator AlpA